MLPLTPQQDKYYKKLKKEMFIEAAGEEITVVNAAAMLTKLLQVSAGSIYTDKKEVIEFDVKNRSYCFKRYYYRSKSTKLLFLLLLEIVLN